MHHGALCPLHQCLLKFFGRCRVEEALNNISLKHQVPNHNLSVLTCVVNSPMWIRAMTSLPVIKCHKHSSCSDLNCSIFGHKLPNGANKIMKSVHWMTIFHVWILVLQKIHFHNHWKSNQIIYVPYIPTYLSLTCLCNLPGCSLQHGGSAAGTPSPGHHCLLPQHSLWGMQTEGTSSSVQEQQAAQLPDPNWKIEVMESGSLSPLVSSSFLRADVLTGRVKSSKQIPQTYKLEFRSQISSCSSLTAPNTVACFGDHLTSATGWLEVKLNKGLMQSCFQSWMVESEEQLRNTSGWRGHHVMQFTGHWQETTQTQKSHSNYVIYSKDYCFTLVWCY